MEPQRRTSHRISAGGVPRLPEHLLSAVVGQAGAKAEVSKETKAA